MDMINNYNSTNSMYTNRPFEGQG